MDNCRRRLMLLYDRIGGIDIGDGSQIKKFGIAERFVWIFL